MGAFIRDDCGAFVYPNGFTFPLEDTGAIAQACIECHAGQQCPLYQLQSSWEATPELVCAAAHELDQFYHQYSADWPGCSDLDTYAQGLEDLTRWAAGVEDLLVQPENLQ